MSCLFNSLSYFVEDSAWDIRQNICDFLANDNVLFDKVKSSDVVQWDDGAFELGEYVNKMRSSSTWGGAIEIKAFAEIYKKEVLVYSFRSEERGALIATFRPDNAEPDPSPLLLEWTGGHYEPIRSRDMGSAPTIVNDGNNSDSVTVPTKRRTGNHTRTHTGQLGYLRTFTR